MPSSEPTPPAERARVRRLPERARYDEASVNSILDEGLIAHVGFAVDSQPFVIPTLYGRHGRLLYLHGSSASRMLRQLAGGVDACVTVTIVDGLVLARSAFHHSMNYRSVVAFGRARLLEDEKAKLHALSAISEHVAPGRWRDARLPSGQELRATKVLEFAIEDGSAKVRTGPPKDDAEDMEWPVWAGVVPIKLTSMDPEPDGTPRASFDPLYLRAGLRRGHAG